MTKRPMGEGFHFKRLMAWAPALLIGVGAAQIARGQPGGFLIALSGVVFGIVVKRRARLAEEREEWESVP